MYATFFRQPTGDVLTMLAKKWFRGLKKENLRIDELTEGWRLLRMAGTKQFLVDKGFRSIENGCFVSYDDLRLLNRRRFSCTESLNQ